MRLIALWKNWEGRAADGKFPLQKWLGGSDHSAVFLTEFSNDPKNAVAPSTSQRAAIKLVAAESGASRQLARWEQAAKLSDAHLLRLFKWGQCEIDGTGVAYVVMEYAEENLAEIVPVRALSDGEAREMLRPATEALVSLHKQGLVHGHIKPSNVMAVDNQLKLSSDGISRTGEQVPNFSVYDAPEIASTGFTSSADMWSLGRTLLTVLTQGEPKPRNDSNDQIHVPAAISEPIRSIVQNCLLIDPAKRSTANDVLLRLSGSRPVKQEVVRSEQTQPAQTVQSKRIENANSAITARGVKPSESPRSDSSKWWIILPVVIAALVIAMWIARAFTKSSGTDAENHSTVSQVANSDAGSTSGSSDNTSSQHGTIPGGVLQKVMPDVSHNALHTVRGRLKVGVQVSVDSAGNVSGAKLVAAGPSQYFAGHALAAARQWKFTPAQVNGQPAASEWMLRFQFERGGSEVSPTETKP